MGNTCATCCGKTDAGEVQNNLGGTPITLVKVY